MKHSAKTEYGAIAVLELARHWNSGETVRIRDIAGAHNVPARFLVQILLQLKAAGLLLSSRGAYGGYRLAVPPDEISLGDIVRILEPVGPTNNHSTPSVSEKTLFEAWSEAAAAEASTLQSLTFAKLLERVETTSHAMYYI
ncbi:MAG: Rrf2 family transcriptional regulator [Pirellulales bacterium]